MLPEPEDEVASSALEPEDVEKARLPDGAAIAEPEVTSM